MFPLPLLLFLRLSPQSTTLHCHGTAAMQQHNHFVILSQARWRRIPCQKKSRILANHVITRTEHASMPPDGNSHLLQEYDHCNKNEPQLSSRTTYRIEVCMCSVECVRRAYEYLRFAKRRQIYLAFHHLKNEECLGKPRAYCDIHHS